MTRGRLKPLLALPLLLVTGCAGGESLERTRARIFGGALAPDDTAVIAVVNFSGGQCSGSLITPQLVLTARHCVADTAGKELQVLCGQTKFRAPDSAGAIFVVSLPEISNDPKDYRAVAEIRMPEGLPDELCGTDVALLRLKEPLTDIPPLSPRLDPPVADDEAYSAVGFGVDESLQDKPSGVRKRLDGLAVSCSGGACQDGEVRDNEWVGSGGPCSGDSGGPALDAAGQVIGVVSRGESGCTKPVFSDLATRSDWLKSEAARAADAARQERPSWAPCDEANPCAAVEPGPKDDASGGCSLSRAPAPGSRGWLVAFWSLVAALRPGRKNMSSRRPRSV